MNKHTPLTKLTKKESKHNRKKDKNSKKIFKILRNPRLPYYLQKKNKYHYIIEQQHYKDNFLPRHG